MLSRLLARGRRVAIREARGRVWRVIGRLRPVVDLRTKQGLFTVSTRDAVIGANLYVWGEYEQTLMADVMDLTRRLGLSRADGTLLDVGANMGITSIGMLTANRFRSAIAVEPDPTNLALLRKNVMANGLSDRIHVVPSIASDRAGDAELELNESNFGDHRVRMTKESGFHSEAERPVVKVSGDTLDRLLAPIPDAERITLGWIDTQGHEAHVLRGGANLFGRGLPTLMEVWPYGLERAGTSMDEFVRVATSYWGSYWVQRHGHFVRYPIDSLPSLFDELSPLGPDIGFDNVMFTK